MKEEVVLKDPIQLKDDSQLIIDEKEEEKKDDINSP